MGHEKGEAAYSHTRSQKPEADVAGWRSKPVPRDLSVNKPCPTGVSICISAEARRSRHRCKGYCS